MSLALPQDVQARPATRQDLDTLAQLFRERDLALSQPPEAAAEFLRWVWGLPYVDLERDSLVLEQDGALQAFAQLVRDPAEGGPLRSEWCVHPSADLDALGAALLTWTAASRAGRPGAAEVRTAIHSVDRQARALVELLGYRRVRTSWDMGKELFDGEAATDPPEGIQIRTFRTGVDEHTMYQVNEAAFRDHWDHRDRPYESYAADTYDSSDWDPTLAYLAFAGEVPAGEAVAFEFERSGYIGSLGVLREFRGRGIGKALLRRAFADLAARRQRTVELSVDAASPTGAVAVYESVGMTPIREFVTYDGPEA